MNNTQTENASEEVVYDAVNKPRHYNFGLIEVIDFIKQVVNTHKNPYAGYCIGNVIKYTARAMVKGKPVEDLQKAGYYLNEAIKVISESEEGDLYVDNGR